MLKKIKLIILIFSLFSIQVFANNLGLDGSKYQFNFKVLPENTSNQTSIIFDFDNELGVLKVLGKKDTDSVDFLYEFSRDELLSNINTNIRKYPNAFLGYGKLFAKMIPNYLLLSIFLTIFSYSTYKIFFFGDISHSEDFLFGLNASLFLMLDIRKKTRANYDEIFKDNNWTSFHSSLSLILNLVAYGIDELWISNSQYSLIKENISSIKNEID